MNKLNVVSKFASLAFILFLTTMGLSFEAIATQTMTVASENPQEASIMADFTWSNLTVLVGVGIFISAAIYSAFVTFSSYQSKDKSHVYYCLSSILLVFVVLAHFGVSAPNDWFYWLPVMLLPLLYGLFTSSFLYLQRHGELLHKLLLLNGVFSVISWPLVVLFPLFKVILVLPVFLIWLSLSLYAAVKTCFRGERYAVYFCVGLGCMLAGLTLVTFIEINSLSNFGPSNGLIMLLAMVFYAIMLSFALVDKFTTTAKRNILSSESLEQLIKERTTELQFANQHLEQLAVDSQAASDAKNTFLVNMSHEIRTPLTAIIGYADGILQGDIKSSARENAIRIISQNGVHLLHIINDLLDISKIEKDELEIEMQNSDPIALLQDIGDSVKEQVQAKGLVLGVNFQLPLPTLMVSDPTRFRQIMLNLINNAIKFTHMGAIEITVTADLDKLYVAVSDTGIGMSQDQIDSMFTAFNQEDLSKSRQYGGIGLGLSIAKSLVNKLGGKINVTSVQGQGSTFTVEFDLTVPEQAKWLRDNLELDQRLADIRLNNSTVQKVEMPDLKGHVLLAEDHLENQLLFIKLLERMGLKVTAVDNGYKAVQATLESEFDLILLDIQMPEMDGLKAFELIQSTCANVPVVALTANAMPADVELYMKLGFNDHIAKPVNREIFIGTVTKYLNIEQKADVALEGDEMDDIKAQYITRLVTRVNDIRGAEANADWSEIGKHAHAIKGSAGMFGFDDLGALGGKLELAVKNEDEDDCKNQLAQLLQLCDAITAKVV